MREPLSTSTPGSSLDGSVNPEPGTADSAQARAVAQVGEAVGQLMEFWNFKPSMGKIWTVLYLSTEPLDAEEIERRTGLSAGNVSMTLADLQKWSVVRRTAPGPERADGGRRRLYVAETDIGRLVARVFAERELRLIEDTIRSLEGALHILDTQGRSSDPGSMLRGRFVVTRVHKLLDLARTGRKIVERLSRTGTASLRPIRDVMGVG